VREKKVLKKKHQPGLSKGGEKGQLEFVTLVSPGTGRDEKGSPMSAPSIHIGALVGAGSLWPNWNVIQLETPRYEDEHGTLWIKELENLCKPAAGEPKNKSRVISSNITQTAMQMHRWGR
jgi:hypothetical protein